MERSGKEYRIQLTECGEDGRCVAHTYEVNESQYVLLLMALGEPSGYTTER